MESRVLILLSISTMDGPCTSLVEVDASTVDGWGGGGEGRGEGSMEMRGEGRGGNIVN